MRIAFDLDNTLIRCGYDFPVHYSNYTLLMKMCRLEQLREGTLQLMRELKEEGNEIWIYTTSFRSTTYIRLLFLLHGINLNGIVNQWVHNRKVKRTNKNCSKYPPAFNIDLLIDDQEGVHMESLQYNFKMIWVKPDQRNWAAFVKEEYLKIKSTYHSTTE